jgi:cysteine desulfurase / selenocysteine lyase
VPVTNPVYFDNAATSWPKPPVMMEAMARFNETVGANPGRSGHSLSVEASRVVYEARELVAGLIGAPDPLSIIFAKNATEAINTVLFGLLKPGDHILTSGVEHNSVMRPLRFLERQGVEVAVIPCSSAGELDPGDVRKRLKGDTKAVVVTHASNVTGTIMPIDALALVAHDAGAILIVDAAQTAGSLPIDVVRNWIDILCFTGHKSLMGPQGTGGFYIRKGLEDLVAPLIRGGTGSASEFEEQPDFLPDKFESGTPNALGLAGLAAGVRHVLDLGVGSIHRKETDLTGRFLEGVRGIPGVMLYGPSTLHQRTAVVSFNIAGMSPSDVAFQLDEEFAILSRPGLHCAPSAHRTIGTFPEGTVRFSFGFFNTEDEIDRSLEAIERLAARGGRRISKGGNRHD